MLCKSEKDLCLKLMFWCLILWIIWIVWMLFPSLVWMINNLLHILLCTNTKSFRPYRRLDFCNAYNLELSQWPFDTQFLHELLVLSLCKIYNVCNILAFPLKQKLAHTSIVYKLWCYGLWLVNGCTLLSFLHFFNDITDIVLILQESVKLN